MKNYLDEIEEKLKKNIKLENIEIIDNSHLHRKHKFYRPGRYHLKLNIKSLYLNSISKINAHKIITKVLKADFETKIHALEINIEK